MERKVSTIGRHLIRIKVLQMLYAYYKTENPDFEIFYKQLESSLKKSYEQYLMFLLILAELRSYAELRITQIQDRQLKNEAEWKHLVRFAENKVLKQLENNADFVSLVSTEKLSIENYKISFKEIFNTIISSEFYDEYLSSEQNYATDKAFVRTILNQVVAETESLFDSFEEYSIFWNDDIDNIVSFVEKTIKGFKEDNDEGGIIYPMFADKDTHDFGYALFTKSIKLSDTIKPYIDKNLKNWTMDRVAELDIIIMQQGIAEMIAFPEIPIPVTMNEYIELAKWYSTEKSGQFINGVMYKISDDLKKDEIIKKKGKGLIEK